MSILEIMIVFVVVGIVLWLINKYIPMEPVIKRLLNIVVVIFLVVWILQALGFYAYLSRPVVHR